MSALYEPAQPAPQYCAIAIWESCGRECAGGGSTGQPTDWRRRLAHAECLSICPAGQSYQREALCFFAGGIKEGLEGIAARPFVRSTTSPVGRVALELVPLPMHTAVIR